MFVFIRCTHYKETQFYVLILLLTKKTIYNLVTKSLILLKKNLGSDFDFYLVSDSDAVETIH